MAFIRIQYWVNVNLPEIYHKTGIALREVDGGRVEVGSLECGVGHDTCGQSHRALYNYQLVDQSYLFVYRTYGDISRKPGGHLDGHLKKLVSGGSCSEKLLCGLGVIK